MGQYRDIEKRKAYLKKWREEHRDKINEYSRKRREAHRDEEVARVKAWRESKRTKCRVPSSPERTAALKKKWKGEHPEEMKQSFAKSQRNRYDKTRPTAHHHYQPWTQKEMEMIIAPDRPSDLELAKMLGRTTYAIATKRCRLLKEEGA